MFFVFVFVEVLRPHRHCIDHIGGGLRPCLSGPTRAVRGSTSQQKIRDNREKSAPRGRQNSNSRPLPSTAKRLVGGGHRHGALDRYTSDVGVLALNTSQFGIHSAMAPCLSRCAKLRKQEDEDEDIAFIGLMYYYLYIAECQQCCSIYWYS